MRHSAYSAMPSRPNFAKVAGAICAVVAGVAILPAIIDAGTGTSICLRKFQVIHDSDRIAAALQWSRTQHFRTALEAQVGTDRVRDLNRLSPFSCCSVRHTGWAGEDKITIYSIASGGLVTSLRSMPCAPQWAIIIVSLYQSTCVATS